MKEKVYIAIYDNAHGIGDSIDDAYDELLEECDRVPNFNL